MPQCCGAVFVPADSKELSKCETGMRHMKNKRILLIIGCILIAGVLITRYTSSLVATKEIQNVTASDAVDAAQEAEGAMAKEQDAAAPGPGGSTEPAFPDELPGTLAAAGRAAPGGTDTGGTGPRAEQGGIPETGAAPAAGAAAGAEDQMDGGGGVTAYADASSGPVSPIEGISGKNGQSHMTQSNDYRQRLVDLDNQIQKLREEDKDATAYTLKNTAEAELKLWESELSSIYSALMEQLPRQEAADLAAEQQEWLKSREARAAEQNSKTNGSNLESVGYITSLVSITRDRTYELVGRYEELTAGDSGT